MKTSRLFLSSTVVAFSVIFLSGCNSHYHTNSGSSRITASTPSSVTINKQIEFKPGTTRVFIQDGRFVDSIDQYKTNCNIEIRKRDDNNWQYVEVARYEITRSRLTEEKVVKRQYFKPQLLAFNNSLSNSNLLLAGAMEGSGPSDIYLGVHYYLSGADSNVMRLSCRGAYDTPSNAEYPTRQEIIETLGEVITVKL